MAITKSFVAVCLIMVFSIFLVMTKNTNANPSFFIQTSGTSATAYSLSATTSVTYQSAGNATTSVVVNSSVGTTQAINSGTFLFHRNASSSASKTQINIEYSQNCDATSADWYAMSTTSNTGTNTIGTFTSTGYSSAVNATTWGFAASTTNGGNGTSTFDTFALAVPVPTKCVRAVMTVPIGANASAIWAEFVGKRETN